MPRKKKPVPDKSRPAEDKTSQAKIKVRLTYAPVDDEQLGRALRKTNESGQRVLEKEHRNEFLRLLKAALLAADSPRASRLVEKESERKQKSVILEVSEWKELLEEVKMALSESDSDRALKLLENSRFTPRA